MAIDDLPLPVVNLLNLIGVPWPYINEDTLIQFAALTREFAQAVQTTHDEAARSVTGIAEAHRGASTQHLTSGWTRMSAEHVHELVAGCHLLASALDVAAVYVVAQKAEAIVVLIGMAEAVIADQAAAVATVGLAEAAVPAILEAARLVVKALIMTLVQHIIGEVIEAVAKPLFVKVEKAMAELDWSGSGGSAPPGAGFSVDPAAVGEHVVAMRGHAATMRAHGTRFQQGVRALAF